MKLSFLGRCETRWRVRVELDGERGVSGLTLGLVSEDGRLLGPQLVASVGSQACVVAELAGPCALPSGTVVRCVADYEDGNEVETTLLVDRRRGLHAFLHADSRIDLVSRAIPETMTRREKNRLGARFPWASPCPACTAPEPPADDLYALLKDEFDIDPDALDDDLRAMLSEATARSK